jgi:hypothetical protein
MRHSVSFAVHLRVLPAAALLLLLAVSCKDAPSSAPAPQVAAVDSTVPPVRWKSARSFRLSAPLQDGAYDPRQPLTLTWQVLDSTVQSIMIHRKKVGDGGWTLLRWVYLKDGRCDLPLDDLEGDAYRIALSSGDLSAWDSSGIVRLRHVMARILEPLDSALLRDTDTPLVRWTADPPVKDLELQWSHAGKEKYHGSYFFHANDSVQSLAQFAIPAGACFDLRIRALGLRGWHTVRNIGLASMTLRGLKEGNTLYRLLPATVDMQVALPACVVDTSKTVLELSIDAGATWERTGRTWLVTEPATESAYLRLRNDDAGISLMHGPFRIVDRTAPLFLPRVGERLRYHRHGSTNRKDTTFTAWITITVHSERQTPTRTEYSCSIHTVEDEGVEYTSSGMLWIDNDLRRSLGGDFPPFDRGPYPNLYDITVDEYNNTTREGIHTYEIVLRRDMGVVWHTRREQVVHPLFRWVQRTYALRP